MAQESQPILTTGGTVAVLVIAVASGSVPALQPILLGWLLSEGRLASVQVGQAATVEALMMALAATLAGARFRFERLPLIAVLGALTMAAASAASMVAQSWLVFVARGVNGAAAGILLWILIGTLTRASNPGRLLAIYVTAQAIGAFLLSTLLTSSLLAPYGAAGGYGVLAALSAALVVPALCLPMRYPALSGAGSSQRPTRRGFVVLAAITCFLSGIFSLWVYLAPLVEEVGHSPATARRAISMGLALQIAGGLGAVVLAGRLPSRLTTIACAIVAVIAVGVVMMPNDRALYAGSALFAFLWMFSPPFHLPMLMATDGPARSALFISPAQLSGIALGPLVASFAVDGESVRGAAIVSIAFFLLCAALLIAAALRAPAVVADPLSGA